MMPRSALLLVSLLAGIALPGVAAPPLVPLDSFVREDEFSTPRLSPDGKYLALTARVARGKRFVPTIMVYGLPGMKLLSASHLPIYEVPLSYTWVSNTRLVIAKGKEQGSLEGPRPTGEVLGMDFDGGKQQYLYGWDMERQSRHGDRFTDNLGAGFVNGAPRTRDGHFFMTTHTFDSQHSMLYKANAATGERKLLAAIDHPYLNYVQQRDGIPRFARGRDKVGNHDILYLREARADKWRVLDDKHPAFGLHPIAFTADDAEFLAASSENGGPGILVRQNISTGKRTTLVSDKLGSITEYQWGANQEMPFAAGTSIGIPSLQYVDDTAPEAAVHKLLSARYPGYYIDFINYTDDGKTLLFAIRSDREPGAYFLFDRATGMDTSLFASRQQIDPEQMAERRPISFKARDGLELHGYLTVPQRADGSKAPLVLLPHGGPHGVADEWFYDNDAQFLASRGYAVLQVNFRGSAGRGAHFRQAGFRQWGGKIQDDLIDGVRWTIAQGLADGGRVCAYGASFGGYAALMVTVRAPELFKCAVGYAGVYDLGLLYKESGAPKGSRLHNVYLDYVGKDPDELQRFSPARQADMIKVPVLLVHGKDDEIADFEHAVVMRAALQKAGRDPEWMAVADEGHGFYATRNVTAFYEKLEAFLGKHLK
jgi:dienelactone hydrolase